MVRQIERWRRAAAQDADPGVRFLHASYGLGVLDILRQRWARGTRRSA